MIATRGMCTGPDTTIATASKPTGIEPDTGLITACDLTAGNVGDAQAAPALIAQETSPVEVLADSAYGSGEFRKHLAEHVYTTATIKPIPLRSAVPHGFTIDDFTIDLDAMTATYPNGITVTINSKSRQARFTHRCEGCLLHQRFTRATGGKILAIHQHHELLAAARAHAHTGEFLGPYRQHRPIFERSIAWLIRRGGRQVRYRGIARNQIGVLPPLRRRQPAPPHQPRRRMGQRLEIAT